MKKALLSFIIKTNDFFTRAEDMLLLICFASMIFLGFIQVIFRYFLVVAAPWTEELIRYLFLYLVFIGAARAMNDDEHIKLQVLPLLIKNNKHLKYINILAYLLTLTALFIYLFSAYHFNVAEYKYWPVSPILRFPLIYVFFSIFIGTVLMIYHLIITLIIRKDIQGYNSIS